MAYSGYKDHPVLLTRYELSAVALEDARHLYLSEEELAQMIAHLVRDPSVGVPGAHGWLVMDWQGYLAKYRLRDAANGDLVVQILRLTAKPKTPRGIGDIAALGREIALSALKDRINTLLNG